jgi:hypothetical protein
MERWKCWCWWGEAIEILAGRKVAYCFSLVVDPLTGALPRFHIVSTHARTVGGVAPQTVLSIAMASGERGRQAERKEEKGWKKNERTKKKKKKTSR